MEDKIPFIHNIEDYENYKKLRPVRYYREQPIKFICSQCKNETKIRFRKLTLDFLCGKCKAKLTFLKNYGVEHPLQDKTIKEKIKETNIKKYGVENVFQSEKIKTKIKETNIKKYNAEYYSKTDEYRKSIKTTNINKYGVDNYNKLEECRNKIRKTCQLRYGVENYCQSKQYRDKFYEKFIKRLENLNITCLLKTEKIVKLKCNLCNSEFIISTPGCYHLLNTCSENFCPNCTRIITSGKSLKEKELLEYIKSIYNKNIEINTRSIISPKEIDIYLPDLKLGFEFDGTYFHADSRFYNESFFIVKKHLTAKEIWEKDKEKDLLCESLGIKLIRIKEYDWDNFKIDIKEKIKKLIIGE